MSNSLSDEKKRDDIWHALHQIQLAWMTPSRIQDGWSLMLDELLRRSHALAGEIVRVAESDGTDDRLSPICSTSRHDNLAWLVNLQVGSKDRVDRFLDELQQRSVLKPQTQGLMMDGRGPATRGWTATPCFDQQGRLTAIVALLNPQDSHANGSTDSLTVLCETIGARAAHEHSHSVALVPRQDELEAFHTSVLDLVEQIVVVYDITRLHPVYSNPYALKFIGFTPDRSLSELTPEPFLHPDDRELMGQVIQALRESQTKQPRSFTGRLRDHQGQWQWIRFNISVYQRDAAGAVTQVIGFGYEISRDEQRQLGLEDANKPHELVDALPDLIFRLNRDGYFLESKVSASPDLLAAPYEFIGKHYREVLPSNLVDSIDTVWEEIFERQETFTHDYELALPDGRQQWFEARLIPVEATEVVAIVRNNTDRQNREMELLREIDFRDALIHTASEGIAVATIDKNIHFLVWNDRMIEITGYTKDEINAMSWLSDLFPNPDIHQSIIECIQATCEGRSFACEEIVLKSRRGEMKTVLASGGPAPLQGSEHGFMTMMQDVTERRHAEERLHDSQQFITRIADASPDFIYVFDVSEQAIIYANRRVEQMLGYSQNDISGPHAISFIDLLHPEDAAKIPELLGRWATVDDDAILETEYRLRAKDGTYYEFWGRDTVFQRDGAGRVKRIIGTAKDVTEWKRAESAIRENETRLRTMLEALENVAVWAHSDTGVITFWNRACERLYGYSVSQAMGAQRKDLFRPQPAADRANTTNANEMRGLGNSPPAVELELERADGSTVVVYSSCVQHDLPGQGMEFFYFDVDMTKHRQAEAELAVRQAELAHIAQLTTMGQFAAELSHEIAQPLSAIGNFSSACERILATPQHDEDTQLRSYVQRITDQTNRCGQILHRLRDFGRRSSFAPQPCSPASLIQESVSFVAGEMRGHRIAVLIDVEDSLPDIDCDRVLLQQVFVNLLANAADALSTYEIEKRLIEINVRRTGDSIMFEFRDNGPGLLDIQADQLFEPYFTTKPAGMGIGLSICQTIVEEHRGSISAASCSPHGAVFRVTLPLTLNAPKSAQGAQTI